MSDLLELLAEIEAPERAKMTHCVMPSMSRVCGTDYLSPGRHVFGTSSWDAITCPECIAPGRREVARVIHLQQRPEGHECEAGVCWWLGLGGLECRLCGRKFAADGRRARMVEGVWEHVACEFEDAA